MDTLNGMCKADRCLSDKELDAVVGGFVIYGSAATGFIIDGSSYFCQNNLREAVLPAIQDPQR